MRSLETSKVPAGERRTKTGGAPGVLFHGTTHQDLTLHPLMHFGSLRSALERLSTRGRDAVYLHAVSIEISNPVTVPDGDAILHHTPSGYARRFEMRGLLSPEQADAVGRASVEEGSEASATVLCDFLKGTGHDGLKYRNRYEDEGSTSWCILSPGQVSAICPAVELSMPEIMAMLAGGIDEEATLAEWIAQAPAPR